MLVYRAGYVFRIFINTHKTMASELLQVKVKKIIWLMIYTLCIYWYIIHRVICIFASIYEYVPQGLDMCNVIYLPVPIPSQMPDFKGYFINIERVC